MIRICMIIMALFVSSQSAYAKWLSKEEVVDVIKNGDVLFSNPYDQKVGGYLYKQLEVWYRMNGIIYHCFSSNLGTGDTSVINTTCYDSRKNE